MWMKCLTLLNKNYKIYLKVRNSVSHCKFQSWEITEWQESKWVLDWIDLLKYETVIVCLGKTLISRENIAEFFFQFNLKKLYIL